MQESNSSVAFLSSDQLCYVTVSWSKALGIHGLPKLCVT